MAPGDTGEAGPALCLWMTWCTKSGLHQLGCSTYFIHSLSNAMLTTSVLRSCTLVLCPSALVLLFYL